MQLEKVKVLVLQLDLSLSCYIGVTDILLVYLFVQMESLPISISVDSGH